MSNVITIATLPLTGTHSMIELFRNKEYNEVDLDKLSAGSVELDETKTNLVSGHIYERNIQTIKTLSKMSQIIVPMRDPLLTFISAYVRQCPQNIFGKKTALDIIGKNPFNQSISGSSKFIAQEKQNISGSNKFVGSKREWEGRGNPWLLWANEIFKLNPFHAPLDLGVGHLKYGDVCFKDIGIHSTKGDYPLKQAYYNRDLPYIAEMLKDNLKTLMDMESILRPPLEELGYRNLLWWDYE